MRAIQINTECGRGSTGKIVVAISRLLDSKNIENYVLYSGNHKSDFKNGIMISNKLSLRVHQLLSRIFGDQGFHSYFSTKKLVRKIKEIDPDVIILHNVHGYYLQLDVLFKFLARYNKPIYWTFHDCWPFTGHCTHFTIVGCERWKTGCAHCSQKKKYPYSWFLDRSSELYKRKKKLFTLPQEINIITPSRWLADLVKKSFLQKYPVSVIHNGINLDVFKKTESDFKERYGIVNKKMILGVSSVWSYAKGLDMMIALSRSLDPKRYQVVLVGTDDAIDQTLPPEIISIHRTNDQRELAAVYSAADVFVNPTREENYPTVNMEAIACGTPVVTFDTGGCSEIVDESCGAIVYSNSFDEIKEKILQTVHRDWSDHDFVGYAERFDERKCFEKYVDLFLKRRNNA